MPFDPDLDRLLTPGVRHRVDHGRVEEFVVWPAHAADVVLPTGEVVGCDHLVNPERPPFTVTVEPGRYPLLAWVASVRDDGGREHDRRVAALQLVVRAEPAVRWELAVLANQDVATLADDHFFGYPVDAGVGTLASPQALAALREWDEARIEDTFIHPGGASRDLAGVPWLAVAVAVTDPATGANVVSVQAGWGDGTYPTYVGRGPDGSVVSFTTWFGLLSFDEHVTTSPDDEERPAG